MLNFIRNLRLSVKIALLGVGSVLITVSALVLLAVWQSDQYNTLAQQEVDELISADLDHITQGIYNLVKTENEAVQIQVNSNLNVARFILDKTGPVSLSPENITWITTNQFTNEQHRIVLPKLMIGNRWLGQNVDPSMETSVVDEITHLIGETSTIFQRINEEGDMLRVATTIRDIDNKRAIGTYIPAITPEGNPNPVIATILKGEEYSGRAFVVNEWYLTAYQPIADSAGKIIGMVYVGVKQKNVESRIRQVVLQTKVGKTGYVYVLGGKGELRGHYIVSQRGERDGEDIWDSKDSDNRYVIQMITKEAVARKSGDLTTVRYRWQNPGESLPRWKIARLAYYEPWDWVIGTSVYEDELTSYHKVLKEGCTRMTNIMGLAGLIIIILIGLLSVFIAWTISRPICQMTETVKTIMEGNLDGRMGIHSGDEIGVLASTFDLMTQKLKETLEGLRKSEDKYRRIFENSIEGLFQTSFTGQVLDISPAMISMLGYDSREEVMQLVHDIQTDVYAHPEDRDVLVTEIREKGVVKGKEIQLKRKDNKIVWVSLSIRLVSDMEGNPLHIQGFAEDISVRKSLEEQLLQSQKIEAIGKLAGGIAHDFNNLLTVINGYCDVILNKMKQADPFYHHICEMQKAGDRAAALTHQLLAFSRKQVMQPSVINLNDLVINIEKMLCRLIGEDVEFITLPAKNLWMVKADPGQIEQVLTNLAVNARDAMSRGGRLSVETANVVLDEDYCKSHVDALPGDYVMMAVSDTGCGIPKQIMDKVFDPFFTTKEKGKGTGLGLSTVYGIIKQTGGSIYVYSEAGSGTVFKVFLPRAGAKETAVASQVQMNASLHGLETILIVEDEEIVRVFIEATLHNYGYKILFARSGSEAVALVESYTEPIHLLLTDINMPKMKGNQLADTLSVSHPTMKVLFMSGYTEDTVVHQGIVDRGIHFIQKPFSPEALLKKIRGIMDA